MSKLLQSLSWSKPAIKLLEHSRHLDPNKPAIMHIRHTERDDVTSEHLNQVVYDPYNLTSTNIGRQAAIDFGSSLPQNRSYTLHHTSVERAKQTAEYICQGIKENGGHALIAGIIPYEPVIDRKAASERGRRLLLKYGVKSIPDGGAKNWVSGIIPNTIRKPSTEFAQEIASINMNNLRNAEKNSFHIYVSHDMDVLVLRFHWFAELPYTDGLPFLDGFLMQLNEDEMQVWHKDECRLYEYPYWWPKGKQDK